MRKMTKEERLAREELTKTQVLNLKELEQVASYEKKISKKPAIILAVLGIMCITIGASYNSVLNILTNSPNKENPSVAHKEIEKNTEPVATVNCQYITAISSEGFDVVVDMTLIFNNGKLNNYTKVMNVTPTLGQEALAQTTIPPLLDAYKTFETLTIPGYRIVSNAKGTGFETIVSIDLKELDPTQLNIYHERNVVTKAEFALNDTKEMVETKAKELDYICK